MRKLTKLVLAACALIAPSMTQAQFPQGGFMGPSLWTDPIPGSYLIGVESSGLCVMRVPGETRSILAHAVLRPCDAGLFNQSIELVPNGMSDAPIDGATAVTWRIMINRECLTIARGVLIGAPAIDQISCGSRDGAPFDSLMGAPDQTWRLRRTGIAGHFQVRSADGRCWTAQGGNLVAGNQLVMEPCDGRRGQDFEFAAIQGDVGNELNDLAVKHFGWFRLPTPHGFTPTRYRAMPRLNLPSGDYAAGIETANDGGLQCAQLCADDAACKGFTWVDPRARGGHPMCYKKNTLNPPVTDDFTNSGIIRPQ